MIVKHFQIIILLGTLHPSKRGSGWGLVALPVFKTDVS